MIPVRTHTVARAAYERVHAHRSDPKKKEYGALAHKLPGMILENGLAQATGFLLAKGKPEHCALLDDLNAVLRAAEAVDTAEGRGLHRKDLPASGSVTAETTVDAADEGRDGRDLHQNVIESDLRQTMVLTRRSLEASGWIKRYVQGVLRVGATGDPEPGEDHADGRG